MVQLLESDIRTREVLAWRGLHVLHAPISSCSQKLRIALAVKGLAWESHVVDLVSKQNLSDWYLGINPRGLVPTLVDDGSVHIESNDIIQHIDRTRAGPRLVPEGHEGRVAELLHHEDALHLDLRNLSFRFLFPHSGEPKSEADLARYASRGSGTVLGVRDGGLQREIEYWRTFQRDAVSDAAVQTSARKFRTAFDTLDRQVAATGYAFGDSHSAVDIAWLVYAHRLSLAGYPLAELHPNVAAWLAAQLGRPEIAREVTPDPLTEQILETRRRILAERRQTLTDVCFPELKTTPSPTGTEP